MASRPDPIRTEILFGTACGLGLSAVIWSLALQPPAVGPAALTFLGLAGWIAGIRIPPRRGLELSLLPGCVLGATLTAGVGAAVLVGLTGSILRGWKHPLRHEGRMRTALLAGSAGAIAAFAGGASYQGLVLALGSGLPGAMAGLALGALAFCALHATIRGLTRDRVGRSPWAELGQRLKISSPSVVVALPLAISYAALQRQPSWSLAGAAVALLYGSYQVGRLHAGRIRRARAERSTELYRSISRALARAAAAWDEDGSHHAQRVYRLCLAVGRRLEMSEDELEALGSAALVHDIGKLAVPEPILRKPERLSEPEMRHVKVHPGVGAEILERMAFPSATLAIVRHHHERWDGTGYPSGLEHEEIPRGARVLAAVDGYEAMVSARPYRRPLTPDEAQQQIRGGSGSAFDPEVIEALLDCLDEEIIVESERHALEPDDPQRTEPRPSAQRHLESLYEIETALGRALPLADRLKLVAGTLSTIIPHRTFAVLRLDSEGLELRPRFALGQGAESFASITVKHGERLSGWAALHRRAVIGPTHTAPLEHAGTRSDLDGVDDPALAELGSTLVAPLVVDRRTLGTLTLYDRADRHFDGEELRTVVHAAGYLARALDSDADSSGSSRTVELMTDALTGLPNGRYLRLEVQRRLDISDEDGLGLLAFRVRRLQEFGERSGIATTESGLRHVARRLAVSTARGETLVRFGPDLFLVLCPSAEPTGLLQRWHELVRSVEDVPLDLGSRGTTRLKLVAARAELPGDGEDLEAVLSILERRLDIALSGDQRTIPFRAMRTA